MEALEEELKTKTVVYCAHRLSSIVNVDHIFVMADGHVVEEGTHYELINKENSLYSQMWRDYLREEESRGEKIWL